MPVIGNIEDQKVIDKILLHLGLWQTHQRPPPKPSLELQIDYLDSQLPFYDQDFGFTRITQPFEVREDQDSKGRICQQFRSRLSFFLLSPCICKVQPCIVSSSIEKALRPLPLALFFFLTPFFPYFIIFPWKNNFISNVQLRYRTRVSPSQSGR